MSEGQTQIDIKIGREDGQIDRRCGLKEMDGSKHNLDVDAHRNRGVPTRKDVPAGWYAASLNGAGSRYKQSL